MDIPAFIEHFTDGSALDAFEQDLCAAAEYGAHGFPIFLVIYREMGLFLRGYQRFETFQSVIKMIAGGAVKDCIPEKSL